MKGKGSNLNQDEFFKLLKYVAGLQNGLKINEINPEEIGFCHFSTSILFFLGFYLPSFPKKNGDESVSQQLKLYDSLIEEEKDSFQSNADYFLKGVPVDVSKLVHENHDESSMNAHLRVIEEELFNVLETKENNSQLRSELYVEDLNPSQILPRDELNPEQFFTFHGNFQNKIELDEKKETKNEGCINAEIFNKGFVASISDVKYNEKEQLDVSFMKKPLNDNNDKVTVSMHIFQNIIHKDSRIKFQKVFFLFLLFQDKNFRQSLRLKSWDIFLKKIAILTSLFIIK